VRNNPYAKRAQSVYSANIVGTGIVPTPAFNGKSDTPRARKLAALWKAWADTKMCDVDNKLNFGGIQSLCLKEIPTSGEILIRRKWRNRTARRNGKRLPVNMQIQVLDADYLDVSKDSLVNTDGGMTVQGVVYDAEGERIGYWIYEENPLNYQIGGIRSNLVPAADIIHAFEVVRAGQVRGIPWFAPVILRMRDYDEYEDAQLIRQKIAACFTAFITDPTAGAPARPGDAPKVAEVA
jgi:lambda family phage portal protein